LTIGVYGDTIKATKANDTKEETRMAKFIVEKVVYISYTIEADSLEEAQAEANDQNNSFVDYNWAIDGEKVENVEEATPTKANA
jgi:hypothetical protein